MADNKFLQTLRECAEKSGIVINEDQFEKLCLFYDLLIDENKRQNLTRITDPEDAAEKHFIDSLTVAGFIDNCARVADVGCGAGFPALPLAIVRPDISIVPIDSTSKRIAFVKRAAEALGLENVFPLAARAEELGRKEGYRQSFDVVTARAVASLNVLSEYCLPLVKLKGKFIAMKANADEELEDAKKAIAALGGAVLGIERLSLPLSGAQRELVVIEKIKNTPPAYPRSGGVIAKRPL